MTGLISLNALIMVARPLNRFKIGLIALMAGLFAAVFLLFGPIFSLVACWWKLALIYLPLMISVCRVFIVVQKAWANAFESNSVAVKFIPGDGCRLS